MLEGLHVHNKINKQAKAGGTSLQACSVNLGTIYLRQAENLRTELQWRFEYSRWDGSQEFLPQSADRVFDQLAEYLMQHGERILQNMDDLEDEIPEIIELIQKEGLIEKDQDGQWRITPRGVRKIQDKALEDLFQTFRRDSLGRHDTPEKGEGSVVLEDTRPYVYGDSLANLNLHETLKNAYVRQGGGVPIKLSSEDYVVHETEYQTRCATVVLIDMSGSMGRYGKYYTTKKVALALQAMVRARYPQDSLQMIGFYTFASLMNERQLLNSAPKPVSIFDSRDAYALRPRSPAGPGPSAFHQHSRGPAAGAERPVAATRNQQTDHRHHRRRADRPYRGPGSRLDLPARRKNSQAYPRRSEQLRQRGHSRLELRVDRRLFLSRPGQFRRRDGQSLAREWPPIARPTTSATWCSTASSAGGASGDSVIESAPLGDL